MELSKDELRLRLKQSRLNLSLDDRQLKSYQINHQLQQLINWTTVSRLHYYEPIESQAEVNINDFLSWLSKTYSDLQLFTSRKINGIWQLTSQKGEAQPMLTVFDVILVPMLGFEPKTLHRLGYGGGYYDKLLVTQPKAKKIGVCFEQGSLEQLPIETHDVALDYIVTEQAVYDGS